MKKYNRKLGSKRSQGIATPKAPQNWPTPITKKQNPPQSFEVAVARGILK